MLSIKVMKKAIRGLITILLDNAVKYTNRERADFGYSGKEEKTEFTYLFLIQQSIFQKIRFLIYLIAFTVQMLPRNSQTGGYGLGLSIARVTVDSHRGKIIAETEDEKNHCNYGNPSNITCYFTETEEFKIFRLFFYGIRKYDKE